MGSLAGRLDLSGWRAYSQFIDVDYLSSAPPRIPLAALRSQRKLSCERYVADSVNGALCSKHFAAGESEADA
jgi:hypothetical protein